jgi:hypothetical protein
MGDDVHVIRNRRGTGPRHTGGTWAGSPDYAQAARSPRGQVRIVTQSGNLYVYFFRCIQNGSTIIRLNGYAVNFNVDHVFLLNTFYTVPNLHTATLSDRALTRMPFLLKVEPFKKTDLASVMVIPVTLTLIGDGLSTLPQAGKPSTSAATIKNVMLFIFGFPCFS